MIYRVTYNGVDILGTTPGSALYLTAVQNEVNTAGSFEFTMNPDHLYYNSLNVLLPDVEVYEGNDVIFYGRPIEITRDFLNRKKVYCEGALAFFNDTIQRPAEFDTIEIRAFFRTLINNHNSQVAANRRFVVGQVTIDSKQVYRKLDYESTFDCIKRMCLEAEGGYLFIRRESGTTYIDWLKDMPYRTTQPVRYALNLTDLTYKNDGSVLKSAVIPLGKEDENGVKLTITDVNKGKDYIATSLINIYGMMLEVVEFNDITDKNILLVKGKEWLYKEQFQWLSIEVDAADLYAINPTYSGPFKIGQMVHCKSEPHEIDLDFPVTKIALNLDTAIKKITIGNPAKPKLTEIYKKENSTANTSNVSVNTGEDPIEIIDASQPGWSDGTDTGDNGS